MGNVYGIEENGADSSLDVEDPQLTSHSPPGSPMASQSPLMFRPELPMVPLKKLDELRIPSPSWTTSSDYDEGFLEECIPTMITWSYGGKEVFIEGSWDDWKSRKALQIAGKDFTLMMLLPSGVYRYRFIIDGKLMHSPDQPWEQDDSGIKYNILDLQEFVPEDVNSISGFEPPQSPESSYNNLQLSQDDFAKEPPMVPPHLNSTLLNVPSPQMEIPSPYSKPQHVVLNHLYMQRDRNQPSVVALGSTNRFLSKYVTVVVYKSIQR